MARLDQSMKHGQTPEVALANFRKAIEEAQAKFSTWIKKVDWSPDFPRGHPFGSRIHGRLGRRPRARHAGERPLASSCWSGPSRRCVQATL